MRQVNQNLMNGKNTSELKQGIRHEAKEHPDVTHGDRAIAEKIAKAHLKEDPKYYTHVEAMERKYT